MLPNNNQEMFGTEDAEPDALPFGEAVNVNAVVQGGLSL